MALMSWCAFGAYWMHLEWRIHRDSADFKGQAVEILLNALQGMDASLAPNENAQHLSNVPVNPASANRRREVKNQVSRTKEAVLNINKMDSAALEALPRIGPKVAGRICRFRSALGGGSFSGTAQRSLGDASRSSRSHHSLVSQWRRRVSVLVFEPSVLEGIPIPSLHPLCGCKCSDSLPRFT